MALVALGLEEGEEAFAKLGARAHAADCTSRTFGAITCHSLRVTPWGNPPGFPGPLPRASRTGASRRGGGGECLQRSRSARGAAPRLRLSAVLARDLVADLLQGATDQARHVHLRDPDLLRDLRLRESLGEAEVEDRALALVEHPEPRREHRSILRNLVLRLLGAE